MRGTIERVWPNETRKGQKYLTAQIDGNRYNVWDTSYFDRVQEGAEIDYDFRQSGDFKHITSLKPLAEQNGSGYRANNGNGPSNNHGEPQQQGTPAYQPSGRDKQITRLSCIKSASQILSPIQLDVEIKRDMVIDTARYFEQYVFNDDFETIDHGDIDAAIAR
jgi:hypothetical protein